MRGYNANRGVKLLTKISQGTLKNQWIKELEKTFTFLKESDQEIEEKYEDDEKKQTLVQMLM